MKIHIPGIGTQYVDEDPPVVEVKVAGGVSVQEAIALAQARAGFVPVEPVQTQVLKFTREAGTESPLVDNSLGVSNPDNISGILEHGKVETPVVPTGTNDAPPAGEPASEPAKVESPSSEFGFVDPANDPLTQ